jgi:hypothetical protein
MHQDSSRRRSEGGDSKSGASSRFLVQEFPQLFSEFNRSGGSDRKTASRRSEGDKAGPEKKVILQFFVVLCIFTTELFVTGWKSQGKPQE